jgi:ribosomal protein S18 acetylase RimI-like enzyme
MTRIIITEASPLFSHAVGAHFTYFPHHVQRRVIGEHSVTKLLMAAIDPRRIILIAKSGRKVIGYAIGAVPKTGPAQMFWLYVSPEHRGANIGLSLLSRMLKLQTAKGAEIISIATHDHRRYYERQGFKFLKKTMVDGVEMDILTFRAKM